MRITATIGEYVNIEFRNNNNETCSLGTYSFMYLDEENDIFDKYQECHNEKSEVILLITVRENILKLRGDIIKLIDSDKCKPRKDLIEKIIGFCDFLHVSSYIECSII